MKTANDKRQRLALDSLRQPGVVWHPYTQHALAPEAIFIARAKGAYLYAQDGRTIFDAVSSWWVTTHGHAEPRIAKAVARQAELLEQVIFAGFTHEPAERLASALMRVAPQGLKHVFFSDDGSTAVEVAMKMAVGYWRNKGQERTAFVALEHAYHGDTFGAMSLSARGPFTSAYQRMLFEVERIPFPERGREERTLQAFKRVLKRPPKIAALIVEPLVLGAGGMRMYGAPVLKELRRLCARLGVLFIADEVMTGFGRTGALFACDLAGILPDILCLSKGITGGFLPLGATLAIPEVYRAFYSRDRARAFFHGHSYTGNPLACAAAAANLEIFAEDPVLERIAAISGVHRRELRRFAGRAELLDTRQTGTIAAVEIRVRDWGYLSELGPKLYKFYLSRNLLLRPLGNVVYLLPPYCAGEKDLKRAYDAIEESLALV